MKDTPNRDFSGSDGVRHLVLWDGDCRVCGRTAHWCEQRDRDGRLQLIAYQDAPSPPMSGDLRLACAEALHVVARDGQIIRAGRAILFIVGQLGWSRMAAILALPPLVWLVEWVYRRVARNRRLLGRLIFRGEAEARPDAGKAESDA